VPGWTICAPVWGWRAPMAAGALAQRLGGQTVLVAEDASGLAGVFTLTAEGVLDLAYVRADRKGDGLTGRLHVEILARARAAGLTVLTVEASHLIRRFLEKRGWLLIESQTVRRNGVAIENHKMSFSL